jgi:carboxymethylenebutenolidase
MQRKTAADFDQELLDIFNDYIHGYIDRRGFLQRAQKFAVGGVTASMLLASLSPNYVAAQVVPKDDKRIKTQMLDYDSPAGYGKMRGYLAMPANASGKLPGVLVIHENRGTNPHIEDIARRLALDNFIAFAPDALAPLGGFPGDEEKAAALFRTLDQGKTREDFVAAAKVLADRPECSGKYGATGFCYGGGIVHRLAARLPELAAGVPFYGPPPAAEDAAKVRAPLLAHFAENDSFVNPAFVAYETALKAAGVRLTTYTYPGTQHGFNNDTTPRFDAGAAKLAWERTVAFFNQYLRA